MINDLSDEVLQLICEYFDCTTGVKFFRHIAMQSKRLYAYVHKEWFWRLLADGAVSIKIPDDAKHVYGTPSIKTIHGPGSCVRYLYSRSDDNGWVYTIHRSFYNTSYTRKERCRNPEHYDKVEYKTNRTMDPKDHVKAMFLRERIKLYRKMSSLKRQMNNIQQELDFVSLGVSDKPCRELDGALEDMRGTLEGINKDYRKRRKK